MNIEFRPPVTLPGKSRPGPVGRSPFTSAFTLIELLVSMAVVALLMVIVLQILNHTRTVTSSSNKHVEADSEARMVFDRIAIDLSKMLQRNDVDYVFTNDGISKNKIFFFSESPALAPSASGEPDSVSLVGYRINSSFQLERMGKGLVIGKGAPDGMVFLTYTNSPVKTDSQPLPASTLVGAFPTQVQDGSSDDNFHVLGRNVFRMSFCFLLKPYSTTSGNFPASYSLKPYIPSRTGFYGGTGLKDVQAVVVAIAILDSTSRKILSTSPNWDSMASALPEPTSADLSGSTPKLMAESWQSVVDGGTLASTGGIPQVVAGQVRVYQRTFYLNTPGN